MKEADLPRSTAGLPRQVKEDSLHVYPAGAVEGNLSVAKDIDRGIAPSTDAVGSLSIYEETLGAESADFAL